MKKTEVGSLDFSAYLVSLDSVEKAHALLDVIEKPNRTQQIKENGSNSEMFKWTKKFKFQRKWNLVRGQSSSGFRFFKNLEVLLVIFQLFVVRNEIVFCFIHFDGVAVLKEKNKWARKMLPAPTKPATTKWNVSEKKLPIFFQAVLQED